MKLRGFSVQGLVNKAPGILTEGLYFLHFIGHIENPTVCVKASSFPYGANGKLSNLSFEVLQENQQRIKEMLEQLTGNR